MKETIGNQVGVFRTTFRRAFISMPILIALVTILVVVINLGKKGFDISKQDAIFLAEAVLFAYIASNCLVFVGLWLFTLVWKVTLFEGGIRGAKESGFARTLAWNEITSAERIPILLRLVSPFHSVLRLQSNNGVTILIYEPLNRTQEFKEQVQRLAGEDHPLTRLLNEHTVRAKP